jgi:hypothetical protein
MTAEEFEAGYADRSGMTVGQLHALGLYPEPCDCGEDMCEGWAMDWAGRHAIIEAARRHG